MVTIEADEDVWRELTLRKDPGDSFNDVLRRVLELDDGAEEPGSKDGDVRELVATWSPDTDGNPERAREQTARAYEWLARQSEPKRRSEIVDALNDTDLSDRSWWERCVQPGLRYLADQGKVEYRSGYHDYSAP
jgi:predicted CopG family antitoxin